MSQRQWEAPGRSGWGMIFHLAFLRTEWQSLTIRTLIYTHATENSERPWKYRNSYSKPGLNPLHVSHPREKNLWQMVILENKKQETKGKAEKEEQISGSDNKLAIVWYQIKLSTGSCEPHLRSGHPRGLREKNLFINYCLPCTHSFYIWSQDCMHAFTSAILQGSPWAGSGMLAWGNALLGYTYMKSVRAHTDLVTSVVAWWRWLWSTSLETAEVETNLWTLT